MFELFEKTKKKLCNIPKRKMCYHVTKRVFDEREKKQAKLEKEKKLIKYKSGNIVKMFDLIFTVLISKIYQKIMNFTISVPQNLSHFDLARILINVMESELKKLMNCGSYFYISFIIKCEWE